MGLIMGHGGSNGYINWNGEGNLEFRYNTVALLTLKQDGNLGIGTTNPGYKLVVSGDINLIGGSAYYIGGKKVIHNLGVGNIFVGVNSGNSITTGEENTYLGLESGKLNSEGNKNTFIGTQAGENNTTGNTNTFIGRGSGNLNQTGSGNVFTGQLAGYNETGSNKLYIDNSNTGYPLIWGDFSTDQVKVNGSLFVTNLPFGDKQNVQWDNTTGQFYYDNSSMRYKENISPISDDFSRLLAVTPKTYTRPCNPGVWEIGYIAEDIDAAGLDKLVWYDENGKPEGINYDKIILYTNENLKELKVENFALKEEIARLKKEMNERFLKLEQQANP